MTKEKLIERVTKLQKKHNFQYTYELADYIINNQHSIWNACFNYGLSAGRIADEVFKIIKNNK